MFVLEKTYREDMELSRIRYMEILRENAELKEKVSFQSEALRKNIEFASDAIERFADRDLYVVAKKWVENLKENYYA